MKKVALADIFEKPISGEWGVEPTEKAVNILRTTNFFNDGRLNLASVVKRDIDAKKVAQKQLKPGDIIIEKSGGSPTQPVGRVVYFDLQDGVYLCNNFTSVLRPKSGVHPKYALHLMYGMHLNKVTLSFQNKTTGIINLKLNNYLNDVKIPLPPLAEQLHIAQVLGQADRLRQQDRQFLAHYDQLVQAVFVDMFGDPVRNDKGWAVVLFSEVGKLDRGVSKHRPRNAPELLGGNHPLIQTGDVARSGGYITNYKSTYSDIGLKQSKLWKKGTLCITIAANIANTGILTFDACFPDSVVGFIPNEKSTTEYVQHWLSFLQESLEAAAPMSAQKNINLEILRNLPIPLPPIELQRKFVNIKSKVEAQKVAVQQLQLQSEALFNSLLQQAFRGEMGPPKPTGKAAAGQLSFSL